MRQNPVEIGSRWIYLEREYTVTAIGLPAGHLRDLIKKSEERNILVTYKTTEHPLFFTRYLYDFVRKFTPTYGDNN